MSAAPQQPPHNNIHTEASQTSTAAPPPRSQLLWAMLLSLLSAFALSQAFRTLSLIHI